MPEMSGEGTGGMETSRHFTTWVARPGAPFLGATIQEGLLPIHHDVVDF